MLTLLEASRKGGLGAHLTRQASGYATYFGFRVHVGLRAKFRVRGVSISRGRAPAEKPQNWSLPVLLHAFEIALERMMN